MHNKLPFINKNFDLSIISDLNVVLNYTTNYNNNNVNGSKKVANKKYYVQHFIDFTDHNSV